MPAAQQLQMPARSNVLVMLSHTHMSSIEAIHAVPLLLLEYAQRFLQPVIAHRIAALADAPL